MIALMFDHPGWVALQQHIARNVGDYLAAVSVLFIASVCMMPKSRPRTIDDWWTLMRDSLQTAIPAARANHAQTRQVQTTTTPSETTKDVKVSIPVSDPN